MDLPANQGSPRWVHVATTPAAQRICAALTLAAGLLGLPGAAHAGPATRIPAGSSVACRSDAGASADDAVAQRLRPSMNGPRLGRALTGESVACARAIVRTVQSRGLPERAAVIAVTTAIAESTLHNRTVATDHDSLGLFQQRPSMGWGRPDQVTDPAYATNKFLDAMIRKYPGDGWLTGDIGRICQEVQKSSFPGAYTPEAHDAQLIVGQLWTGTPAPRSALGTPPAPQPATTPAAPTQAAPTQAAPTQAAGPFQRSLAATHTGLGPTDQRHHMSAADWNGDRRADLVVVQGAGTATGKTELHIMNGASSFQAVLLHTATALGPTDERHAFSLSDWNADGRPDLVAVQSSGTASGRTELRIVDGASNFQRLLLEVATGLPASSGQAATALPAAGDQGAGDQEVSLADWNADGRLDLVAVRKPGTAGGRPEVRIADGAANFQKELPKPAGTLDAADEAFVTDWNADGRPDLVTVRTSATAGQQAEVRVLDGASDLRRPLVQTGTALGPTDQSHDLSVADWNGDGRPDLVAVRKSGTATGRTEALVLDGTA